MKHIVTVLGQWEHRGKVYAIGCTGIWQDGYRGSIVTVVGQWEHRGKVCANGVTVYDRMATDEA